MSCNDLPSLLSSVCQTQAMSCVSTIFSPMAFGFYIPLLHTSMLFWRDCRWIPDELGVTCFAHLDRLKTVPVASFDQRFDVWHVEVPLSEGCGGPELPQEIML